MGGYEIETVRISRGEAHVSMETQYASKSCITLCSRFCASEPFLTRHLKSVSCYCHTWAERIAWQLLDALSFTDGPSVEWSWVGTAACPFLETTAASAVTH